MANLSRRNIIAGAAFAAALGLDKRLAFITPALAQKTPDPSKGFHKYKVGSILISHFPPDHICGLMQKGINAPTFPNAELVVTATEYNWWTEPGRVEKLPEARKGLGTRINAAFPGWKNFKLIEGEKEVAP